MMDYHLIHFDDPVIHSRQLAAPKSPRAFIRELSRYRRGRVLSLAPEINQTNTGVDNGGEV